MKFQRQALKFGAFAAGKLNAFWKDKEGLGTLEIVLIAAVIIAIAILFREWILDFLDRLFGKVEDKSDSFFG